MITRLQTLYRTHTDFILLLLLFITFRGLTIAAFRPGGLVLDFSDFYWYRSFAELTHQGYYPYDNLWTTYPPLFPLVMIALYQVSSLLPPWTHPNLWFTLLLGGFFLLFEVGNFILLYLFSLKIYGSPTKQIGTFNLNPMPNLSSAMLRPCWIYAGFFVPVYTLTGWFESYPLFFFLLSLYLLLENRPYLSAIFTGIGFMIKLIPLILLPVAVQRLSVNASGPVIKTPLMLTRLPRFPTYFRLPPLHPLPLINYVGLFLLTITLIGLPFYWLNPALFFGPQLITAAREPWETIWALIDGNYNYGIIPLDMRDLAWTPTQAPPTRINWLYVTGIAALFYGLFYTRRIDWHNPRKLVAFVAFTNMLFMVWSKGYSPQWLGWPLYFIALLLPNWRGVMYAIILSVGNILEANFFFIMFPDEHWFLAAIVINRTLILIMLMIEFLWLIWPASVSLTVLRWHRRGWVVYLLVLLGLTPLAVWQLGDSYQTSRLQLSPYRATISRLQEEPVTGALLLNDHHVFDWFYPYLRHDYRLSMLDDYAPANNSVERRTFALLTDITHQTDVLWIYDVNPAETTPAETVLFDWLNERPPAHIQDVDGGRLYLFILD
ncbi:hypothetical protein QUF64_09030 [Anaerolineales bacterium HSG6]|nr:hypothetical protein [Anaerolineales bacterium HSG6]